MEDEGWDLQAVVRGCCGPTKTTTTAVTAEPFSSFPPGALQEGRGAEDDLLFCFPELFGTQAALHELEDLCKPFFSKSSPPQQQQQLLLSPQRSPSACMAAPLLPNCAGGAAALPLPQQQIRQLQHRPLHQTPRSKRRKNQQKRVVCQVPADSLSSDMWAWRKYGQKPIKGSPYPRSYYRCSSSKGCLARKQVERSRTDPGLFVITYTAEHNHPVPTHRNSLAGSTRQKFPPSSSAAKSAHQVNSTVEGGDGNASGGSSEPEQTNSKGVSSSPMSSPTAAGLSPSTPLTSSMEDELLLPRQLGGQEEGDEEVEEQDDEEQLLVVDDMEMLGEEDVLFTGLGELRHPNATATVTVSDGFPDHFAAFLPPWMASGAAATAGGS